MFEDNFKYTLSFAEFVNSNFIAYSSVKSRISLFLGEYYKRGGDLDSAVEFTERSLSLIEKDYSKNVALKSELTSFLGQLALLDGDAERAEEYFLHNMSRSWYCEEGELVRDLRRIYILSLRGLIECHKFNPEKLRNMQIIPSVRSELKDDISLAIDRAETYIRLDLIR